MHPGAGHTWGECHENACNCANNNQSHAHGASGGQRRSGQKPQQRGEAQGHFVETIDSTMEQEDVSELPGGPTEISDSSPMVQDEEEQFIADEQAPRAATAESFPAFSFPASPPSLDSTGRPTPVHRTRPSQWGAASVPQSQATQLPLHAQWGHCKPPNKHTVPHKETPKPSLASVKKAPLVAAPHLLQGMRLLLHRRQEMVSTYSQSFTFLLSALPLQCKKLITLICFRLMIRSLSRVLIPMEFV